MVDEAIPILRVAHVEESLLWYRRLGYAQEWEHRFQPAWLALVSVARHGAARLFLSEHRDDARPDTLVYIRVSDIDAVAAEFAAEFIEQPWGREVHLSDPDGNRLRIGCRRQLTGHDSPTTG